VKVIVVFPVPVPVPKVRPAVDVRVRVPLVTLKVTRAALLPASTSPMDI
jgi:hypothetical protein